MDKRLLEAVEAHLDEANQQLTVAQINLIESESENSKALAQTSAARIAIVNASNLIFHALGKEKPETVFMLCDTDVKVDDLAVYAALRPDDVLDYLKSRGWRVRDVHNAHIVKLTLSGPHKVTVCMVREDTLYPNYMQNLVERVAKAERRSQIAILGSMGITFSLGD